MPLNKLDKSKSLNRKKASPSRRKRRDDPLVWFRPEAKRWYILLSLSMIISILLFPSILTPPKAYKLGDVADRDIKASREFLVENNALTEQDRQEAVRAVLSVYDFDPTATDVVSKIKEAFQAGREYIARSLELSYSFDSGAVTSQKAISDHLEDENAFNSHFFGILNIPYNKKLINIFIRNDFSPEAEKAVIGLVTDLFNSGVVGNKVMLMSQSGKGIILHNIHDGKEDKVLDLERFYDLKTAGEFINERGKVLTRRIKPKELAKMSLELAAALIKPNLTFNKRATALRKEEARKSFISRLKRVKCLSGKVEGLRLNIFSSFLSSISF